MFIYAFSLYAGGDRVFHCPNLDNKFKSGDLIKNIDGFFLVLGSEVSFPELFSTLYTNNSAFDLVEQSLISEKTMLMLHRMTYQRYAPYKTVLKLFLDSEIDNLLDKKPSKKTKAKKAELSLRNLKISTEKNQILLIFPDLRSRQNLITQHQNLLFLSAQDSTSKKNTNRRNIKNGVETLIATTSSEIFQDFSNLTAIYFLEPQKRYYASQQDPRYKVSSVIHKLAELHQAKLHIIDSENLVL